MAQLQVAPSEAAFPSRYRAQPAAKDTNPHTTADMVGSLAVGRLPQLGSELGDLCGPAL
jgi:hypothetical protein